MRISITSLNLWNTEHLEKRAECLTSFLRTYKSDIFCFQEIRPELITLIDSALPEWERVVTTLPNWNYESNIYYKKEMFTLLDYTLTSLEMPEKLRGLFTIKLMVKENGKELFVNTVHFTHQGNADELRTGMPYRPKEAHLAALKLKEMVTNQPCLLTGDFNDPLQPARILNEDADLLEVFTTLGLPSPVTFPCPYLSEENYLVEAIDKIMYKNCTPLMASSPHFYIPGGVLSDHWPVMAMFELF